MLALLLPLYAACNPPPPHLLLKLFNLMSFCCHCYLLCSGVFCATLLFLKWEGCPWSGCCFPVLAFMELMKRTGNLEQSHTAKCNFSKYANKSWLKACLWYSFWLKRSWLNYKSLAMFHIMKCKKSRLLSDSKREHM